MQNDVFPCLLQIPVTFAEFQRMMALRDVLARLIDKKDVSWKKLMKGVELEPASQELIPLMRWTFMTGVMWCEHWEKELEKAAAELAAPEQDKED